jgi:hypothetical protein
LDKLQIQPLIINLGLLLKPMYQDSNYLENLRLLNEIEVKYDLNNDFEINIKNDIDNWLRSTDITLETQEECRKELLEYYAFLGNKYGISANSKKYITLRTEVLEMLTMKLTMLSLMDDFLDDSTKPVPIR